MPRILQVSTLGGSIQTGEIDDKAVTLAKLADEVDTEIYNQYSLKFRDTTTRTTSSIGFNTIHTFSAQNPFKSTDWLYGVAINLSISHDGDHAEDQIRVQVEINSVWKTVWQVTGFANMTDRRIFIARQDFTDGSQDTDSAAYNVRVQAGAGSSSSEGYTEMNVNLLMARVE